MLKSNNIYKIYCIFARNIYKMDNQQLSTLNGKSSETISQESTQEIVETEGINLYKIYGLINRCIINKIWYKNRYFFEQIN
jgi:hypothetical protein